MWGDMHGWLGVVGVVAARVLGSTSCGIIDIDFVLLFATMLDELSLQVKNSQRPRFCPGDSITVMQLEYCLSIKHAHS